MSAATIRTVRLQARSFHKAALNSVLTDAAGGNKKTSYPHHYSKHNQIEQKQSPATRDDTSARADWQRYRDIEHHQIWLSSPQKHFFQTKLSSQDAQAPKTGPTPAMTFQKNREMHIAARQASRTVSEENENPDRKFMKTWLGVVREIGYARSDWLDAVLADGKKGRCQTFMGRLFGNEPKTRR